MKITINRQEYSVNEGELDRKLLWFLRDDLGLVGTRYGCGAGLCGACIVLVDGQPYRSCITPIGAVTDGQLVETVEGLGSKQKLHPVQRAFIEEQAPQCGWCMSGQMMMAVSLLNNNPTPTDKEIEEFMTQNYCRCGSYNRLRRAVKRASRY